MDLLPKWLTHGFCPKMGIFSIFFLGKIGQNYVFYDILERKNAVVGCKNNKFKKYKNLHFSKGVSPWFLSKYEHISNFFFQAIWARIMSFTIFESKKMPFQAVKTISSKSVKIDIFLTGLTHGFEPKNGHISNLFFQAVYRPAKCILRYSRTKKRWSRL